MPARPKCPALLLYRPAWEQKLEPDRQYKGACVAGAIRAAVAGWAPHDVIYIDEPTTSVFKRHEMGWTRAQLASATFQGLSSRLIPEQAMALYLHVSSGPCWEWNWQGRKGAGSIKGHQSNNVHFSLDSGSSYFSLGLSQLELNQSNMD